MPWGGGCYTALGDGVAYTVIGWKGCDTGLNETVAYIALGKRVAHIALVDGDAYAALWDGDLPALHRTLKYHELKTKLYLY